MGSVVELLGSRAQARQFWFMGLVAGGMWDLPGSGIELLSPALAGFMNTVSLSNINSSLRLGLRSLNIRREYVLSYTNLAIYQLV